MGERKISTAVREIADLIDTGKTRSIIVLVSDGDGVHALTDGIAGEIMHMLSTAMEDIRKDYRVNVTRDDNPVILDNQEIH